MADGPEGSDRVKVIYRVKQGDTLGSIAKLFKTTVASIRTWNRIPGSYIAAGDRLIVYARSADRDLCCQILATLLPYCVAETAIKTEDLPASH